jgi:hypothetical protein
VDRQVYQGKNLNEEARVEITKVKGSWLIDGMSPTGKLIWETVSSTTRAPRLCEANEMLAAHPKLASGNGAINPPASLATRGSSG